MDDIVARGVLREAQVSIRDHEQFCDAERPAFEDFFVGLRVFLFAGERPVGSISLFRCRDGSYMCERVSLEALGSNDDARSALRELLTAMEAVEQEPGAADCEVAIIQFPQLSVTALTLLPDSGEPGFRVVSPPYPEALAVREREDFRRFIKARVDHHRSVFV